MGSDKTRLEALNKELDRLGLTTEAFPGGGLAIAGANALEQLIARLRTLKAGVTWRDVFPDLPPQWKPNQPETWISPYEPLGPYDYQELPTGPAIHVCWEGSANPEQLQSLTVAATDAGWPVYGAGLVVAASPNSPTTHAMIVLARGTSEATLSGFVTWLEARAPFRVAAIPRTGAEDYDQHGGAA